MDRLISIAIEFFQRFSFRQRMVLIAGIIALVSAVISVVMWANRPEYELLYSRLDPATAATIVDDLRSANVKYRLENGGTTVYVPRADIPELRIKFAQAGYLKDGVIGYEIFEEANMGMTTFMQRLNMRRALEGELTRTINHFPEVQQSRVHLVLTESRLFEKDRHGSASVVLFLKPGTQLNEQQISGIGALVANSVEDIDVENVAVLDSRGKILGGGKENSQMGDVGNQWELQATLEIDLRGKIIELVEGIVGMNNTRVQVSAEMNFDRLERTTEEVDPDKVVVLSEETYTESSNGSNVESGFEAEKVTSNYELSKKFERFTSGGGSIKRLTVAVLVNGGYETVTDADGVQTSRYVPRGEEELAEISALVKSAVGYSEARGDIIEVRNLQFDNSAEFTDQQLMAEYEQQALYGQLGYYGVLLIGLLLAFFLVKGLMKGNAEALALAVNPPAAAPALEGSGKMAALSGAENAEDDDEDFDVDDAYLNKLSPEARKKLKVKSKMTEAVMAFADSSPEDATRLLRSWLTVEKEPA